VKLIGIAGFTLIVFGLYLAHEQQKLLGPEIQGFGITLILFLVPQLLSKPITWVIGFVTAIAASLIFHFSAPISFWLAGIGVSLVYYKIILKKHYHL
jgi:hypothetical protein